MVTGLDQLLSVNVALGITLSLMEIGNSCVKFNVRAHSTMYDVYTIDLQQAIPLPLPLLVSRTWGLHYLQASFFKAVCEAKSEGLVRYPATLAPTSGSVTVTAQCADNAHIRSGSNLSVRCTSTGSWSRVPQCQCDTGYHAVTLGNGKQICQLQCKGYR